jgi:hypothetical protein
LTTESRRIHFLFIFVVTRERTFFKFQVYFFDVRKRVLASDRLHACRMKRSYPNDKKACKSPAQRMLPSNEDEMIIADDQTHMDIQMMDDGAACALYLSIYNRSIIYTHAQDHCTKIDDITETAIRNFLRYSDRKKTF